MQNRESKLCIVLLIFGKAQLCVVFVGYVYNYLSMKEKIYSHYLLVYGKIMPLKKYMLSCIMVRSIYLMTHFVSIAFMKEESGLSSS